MSIFKCKVLRGYGSAGHALKVFICMSDMSGSIRDKVKVTKFDMQGLISIANQVVNRI